MQCIALIISMLACSTLGQTMMAAGFKHRVLYTQGYARGRGEIEGCEDYGYQPKDIDPFLPTHVVYGFFGVDPTTFKVSVLDPVYSDIDLQQLRDLKKINPALKTQVSIGGGYFTLSNPATSGIFPQLMKDAKGPKGAAFAQSLIDFARKEGLDGIDLDYEWPRTLDEGQQLADLCQTVYEAFEAEAEATGKPRLELSAALAANNNRKALPLKRLTDYLDFALMMTYELRGAWSGYTEAHTVALECGGRNQGLSIAASMDWILTQGADHSKILLGLASYGRTYRLATPGPDSPEGSAAIGDGPAGPCLKERANLSYYEIKQLMEKYPDNTVTVDNTTRLVAHMTYGDQNQYWVGFDNPATMRAKLCYAKSLGIGGVFMWDQANDDQLELFSAVADAWYDDCVDYCAPTCDVDTTCAGVTIQIPKDGEEVVVDDPTVSPVPGPLDDGDLLEAAGPGDEGQTPGPDGDDMDILEGDREIALGVAPDAAPVAAPSLSVAPTTDDVQAPEVEGSEADITPPILEPAEGPAESPVAAREVGLGMGAGPAPAPVELLEDEENGDDGLLGPASPPGLDGADGPVGDDEVVRGDDEGARGPGACDGADCSLEGQRASEDTTTSGEQGDGGKGNDDGSGGFKQFQLGYGVMGALVLVLVTML